MNQRCHLAFPRVATGHRLRANARVVARTPRRPPVRVIQTDAPIKHGATCYPQSQALSTAPRVAPPASAGLRWA
eukprot:7450661-Alexandrium_andersonii.AAC.1